MKSSDLYNQASTFSNTPRMPVLFVGHGTPMNAIEDNEFAQAWSRLGTELPIPNAILCVSAHWETRGTFVTAMEQPKTIHDFYGFPQALYSQEYPAKGSPQLADEVSKQVTDIIIGHDTEWGLDHGCWSVLKYLYPDANIPVVQLSIDHFKDTRYHYSLAKELDFLRHKGVLIIGSGNMIHNLRMINVEGDDFNAEHGYGWAFELNDIFKQKIEERNFESLINYQQLHDASRLAIPTPEHYIPMLYALALCNEKDVIDIFNDKVIAGSLSMTSLIIR